MASRVLHSLLASPPALRTEICQSLFCAGTTRPLATHSACDFRAAAGRTPSFSKLFIQQTRTGQRRFQTTTAADSTSPAPSKSTSTSIPNGTSDNSTSSPPRRSLFLRILTTSGIALVFFVAGFSMAAGPAVETARAFLNPPTDEETLTLFQPDTPNAAEINDFIVNHPLSKKLRAQEGMSESRPHLKIPAAMRAHNLTAGTLLGENKIEVPPLTFNERHAELPKLVQMSYLGPGLCGHPGIVHGGMLATMLDEGLARTCFPALPNKVGVTASLKIDYRQPCPGSSYVVLKAETTKVEGRKAWVKGWIEILGEEDGTGVKVVEAEALFIEPKQASSMARVYSSQ